MKTARIAFIVVALVCVFIRVIFGHLTSQSVRQLVSESQGHSDGYQFLVDSVRNAPATHDLVGDVEGVRWDSSGTYHESFGDRRRTDATLLVTGSKGSIRITATASRTDGHWHVDAASVVDRINLSTASGLVPYSPEVPP
jgi:hypothetical protein